MPVSKTRNRGKSHKRHPQLSEKEKFRKKVNKDVSEAYANTPDDSIAITIARQNSSLRNHLNDPRGYFELLEQIENDPAIGNIEYYGYLMQRSGLIQPRDAVTLTYSMIAYRAVEQWKHIAQTYFISAPLLDEIFTCHSEIACGPQDFILPFKTFFVDLGTIIDTDLHAGIFVHQHPDDSQIDFAFINGELITSISLGDHAHVKMPTNPEDCHLGNLEYVGFLLVSLVHGMRLNRTIDSSFVDVDNFSHEHNEWRTYMLRPAEGINDYVVPHWAKLDNGQITYLPHCVA